MSSIAEILAAEFELLKEELLAAYEASGMAASGDWANSLEVRAAGNSAALLGYGYIQGRKPGTPPPSDAIEQWIKDKGIAKKMEKDINTGTLAWLIARKIGRDGWQPEEDIISKVATPERIQQILDRIGDSQLEAFTRDIINYFKTAAA